MQNTETNIKNSKIKLDFKDSKYATGRRKLQQLKFGLKKALVKFMLMEKFLLIIFQVKITKC